MQIRNAQKADIESIFKIAQEEFGKNAWTKTQFDEELVQGNRIFIVAEEGGIIFGYLTAMQLGNEMELLDIAVEHNSKRKHIATAMLNRLLAMTNGSVNKCFLEVAENNQPAIKLYEKYGFKEISRRKSYYNLGETAIVMEKICG